MNAPSDAPVLVTGATGKTGRRVAGALAARGVPVRAVSRSTDPRLEWQDPSTWPAVLDGVRSVFLSIAEVDEGPVDFVAAAVAAGVERIVLVSARGISTPGHFDDQDALAAPFLAREAAVAASGASWSILRPGWFMQNFSEGDFHEPVRAGRLELPVADGAATWVDAADIADVAVALLLDGGHEGETLELGGPEALTVAEALAVISRESGRRADYVPISNDEYRDALRADGAAEADIDLALAAVSAIRRGREASLVDGVSTVLHRPPRSFAEFAHREADAWH